MRIAIFGSGGVGGYFGGRLAQAVEDVIFIARGEHLRAIRQNGLRVDSILGDFLISPARASDNPAEVGTVDMVLVAVKAWQVPEAAEAMKPMVGPETIILPLENGVDAPDQLAAVLGAEHVLGGLCRISVFIAAPGHIKHVAIQPHIAFGELNGRPSERVEVLQQAFARAQGMTVAVPLDIRAALWEKFLFIAAISGVGAVTRQPAGNLRSVPETRTLLLRSLEEIEMVAKARGISLSPDIIQKTMGFIDNMPPATLASMQRDIMDGRPSELEAQNGAVVRLGREAGVSTPTHEFIYASLLPGELKARGEIS
ncbi:MAG: 2-dehydropantoate 2-reductase [Anaerolineales bacterium]|nr:2-dehydropantoate 2-reductase [Anaerolineales bacterium]